MKIDIPKPENRRVVIIGGGFAGLTLAKFLLKAKLQVVLIDKNNYHAFPPLLYQVATADLESTAIAFPFRKIFRNKKNFFFRMAEVQKVDPDIQLITSSIGDIAYDYLIIATGSKTNFFNMDGLKISAMPMKNINQAINLRHMILQNFEKALGMANLRKKKSIMNYVIAGGGPTGVELAGALGEIKKNVLPSEYPELDPELMQVTLIQAADRILPSFSEKSSAKAKEFLEELGVKVQLDSRVTDYFGDFIQTHNNKDLIAHTLIWTAGVTASPVAGIEKCIIKTSNRIAVDAFNQAKYCKNVFAIGDVAAIITDDTPLGHPMIAPVAIQQAQLLSKNLIKQINGKQMSTFNYKDKGSMATIGKNRAVVEMGRLKMQGRIAWYIWMLVHLLSLVGFSKKINVFITWTVNYFSKDRGVQLILRHFDFQKMKAQRKEQIKNEKYRQMKKTTVFIALLLLSFNSYAQQDVANDGLSKKNHVLKTNVLGLFTFFYEHSLKKNISLQVGLQYNPESLPAKNKQITSIAPELRFYLKPRSNFPSGFFVAPYVKYQYLIDKKEIAQNPQQMASADIRTFAVGGNTGYQIILNSGLSFEVFAGAGYNVFKNIATDNPDDFSSDDYNFDIRFGLGIGCAF